MTDAVGIVRPMPHSSRPGAIIFDLDGTLVDTVGNRIDAWAAVLGEAGIRVTVAQIRPMIGMDGRRLASDLAAAAGVELDRDRAEELDRRAGELFDQRNRDPRPLPGATRLLERLDAAGVTWGIATSSRPQQVRTSLDALGLSHEPRVVDGHAVEHAKPAPDLLLLAARQLDVEPAATWYVGDSTWDMRAAVAARMRPIAVLAGAAVDRAALEDAGAETILDSLDQLEVPA